MNKERQQISSILIFLAQQQILQQCVYQTKFRNVCKAKKRLVEPGLVWSRTLSMLLSMNGESVSLPVFA